MISNITWKPKYGEKYYYIDIAGFGDLLIANKDEVINRESFINLTSDYYRCAWQEGDDDYINLFTGNVFRTEEEAKCQYEQFVSQLLNNDTIWKLEAVNGYKILPTGVMRE